MKGVARLIGAAGVALAGAAPAQGLPAFAPLLAERTIAAPGDWPRPGMEATLAALAQAAPGRRQAARWDYAAAMLASGRSAEALGALDTMMRAEPDLGLAGAFQLARGRALVELARGAEAASTLDHPALAGNAEACAWRLRALAGAGAAGPALAQLACAKPALAARSNGERAAFLVAAARAALAIGRADAALHYLGFAPLGDREVMLALAEARLAAGKADSALPLFQRVAADGDERQRAAAELGLIEAELRLRRLTEPAALKRLELLRLRWRGDGIERQAALRSYQLARANGRLPGALAAAATLLRHHVAGGGLGSLLAEVQAMLGALLQPGSGLPLAQAAGLYWEYRDLAPGGAEGDALAWRLADRLQEAQLHSRAAELLEHQLVRRDRDVAQGPLSVRVARSWILAGRPDRALHALKLSGRTIYPPAMLHDRQRAEAVALQQLGRGAEAVAVLQSVPGSADLQAELLWKQRRWSALAELGNRTLPPPGALSEVRQAVVLRQAITLGMLNREQPIAALRARYRKGFRGLPTERAFDLLTRPAGSIDPSALSEALAAVPTVSPAGEFADLLDAAPEPRRARAQRR